VSAEQHAADLRIAVNVIRSENWVLEPDRSLMPLLAARLEAHADALDAAVAAGEPCPCCAERMELVPDTATFDWQRLSLDPPWWRFVTPEATDGE
jgi:hypothetical protein